MDTIENRIYPIFGSVAPPKINYESIIQAMITTVGKRVLSKPMGPEAIFFAATI